jgi:short-subunit dehydrogenase
VNGYASRTVAVTGASSGIGRAFARRLARDGASVVLVARDRGRLDDTAAELSAAGAGVEVVVADLSAVESLDALAPRLADLECDLLVNAAGLARFGPLAAAGPDDVELQVRVNVIALMRLTHAVLPGMVARGRGALINVSSLMAFDDRPGWTAYLASKAFVTRFTENLAIELEGTGVGAQALCPGPVGDTEFFARAGFDPTVFPAEVVMDPDAVVEASFAALARGEVVCVPGLDDPAAIEDYRLARLRVLSEGRRGDLARRYQARDTIGGIR